jgi:hypothetical protein
MSHRPWATGVDAATLCEARQCGRCGRVEIAYDDHGDVGWLPVGEHATHRGCRARRVRPRVSADPTTFARLRAGWADYWDQREV